MEYQIVVRGRLVDALHVELDEAVPLDSLDVEVIVRRPNANGQQPQETVPEFLRRMTPGTRTREDIDRQIAEDRDSWGDR